MAVGKVKVPRRSGEYVVRKGGADPVVFQVKNGLVSPRTEAERDLLLDAVAGAKPVPATPKD